MLSHFVDHPLATLATNGTLQGLSPEQAMEVELRQAPLDAALRECLGISADAMAALFAIWHRTAVRGRRTGGVVHAVLLARLAEWIGLQDGAEGRAPLADWASLWGWPPAMAAPWEAAYRQGWLGGRAWRSLEPWRGILEPGLARMFAAPTARQRNVLERELTGLLAGHRPVPPVDALELWFAAARRAHWERRMTSLARRTQIATGSLASWWQRTSRVQPHQLGRVRGWWAMTAGALGWTAEEFAAAVAGQPLPPARPDSVWEMLASALSHAPLPGVPWPMLSIPTGRRPSPRERSPMISPETIGGGDIQHAWLAQAGAVLSGKGAPAGLLSEVISEALRLQAIERALGWPPAGAPSPTGVLLAHHIIRAGVPPAPFTDPTETHRLLHDLAAQVHQINRGLAPWAQELMDQLLAATSAPIGQRLLELVAPEASTRLAIETRWVLQAHPTRIDAVVDWMQQDRTGERGGFPAAWPAARRTPGWVLAQPLRHRALVYLLPLVAYVDRVSEDNPMALRQAWREVEMRWRAKRPTVAVTPHWERTLAATLPLAFLASYLNAPLRTSA